MSEDHSHRIGEIHRDLHSHLPPEPALRVKALESLLVEKGMLVIGPARRQPMQTGFRSHA